MLFLICFMINCQNKNTNSKENEVKRIPKNEHNVKNKNFINFVKVAETSDMLYLNDSSSYYLMNESPLKAFSDYRDIFDAYYEYVPIDFDMGAGSFIPPRGNTSYWTQWFLTNDTLYISNIKFFKDPSKVFPIPDIQYTILEGLTQVKFNNDLIRKYDIPDRILSKKGLMPAIWVNDIFVIKKTREANEDYELWMKTPCIELVFKNGKLISERTTDIY